MACLRAKPFHTPANMETPHATSRTWWWLAPVVALALFLVNNAERTCFKRDLAALEQRASYPIRRDPASLTGYQWGQRSQILSPDGCHWVMQTQRMLADGDLRVRKADYDNHPDGREVHWSASMHWWLGGPPLA